MNDPTTRQVGGDHYLKLGMQPFHFSLANGWDGASHTILKYVSRHHNVDRVEAIESLRKAIHIVEIIEKAISENRYVNTARMVADTMMDPPIRVSVYTVTNDLGDLESLALQYLQAWLLGQTTEVDGTTIIFGPVMVKNAIEDILFNRYGVTA